MTLLRWLMLVIPLTLSNAINRPVYKIILTQKGYAQFLQYDVETPPIREFTFCIWLKIYEFTREQSIFTYVTHGNNRILRLWLDTGGRYMKVAINGKVSSSNPVDLMKDVWHNICLSYQSDYGAWALYADGHLVSCEAAETLSGFVIPPNGRIILGYGTSENGESGGLEGEIFGANMILTSTIERNYTMKRNPRYRQKKFHKNKVMGDRSIKYTVLGEMALATIRPSYESTTLSSSSKSQSFIAIKTSRSDIEHDDRSDHNPKRSQSSSYSNDESLSYNSVERRLTNDDDKVHFWNLINEHESSTKLTDTTQSRESYRRTKNTLVISEYESTPPTVEYHNDYSGYKPNQMKIRTPIIKPLFDVSEGDISQYTRKVMKLHNRVNNIEMPQHSQNDQKVHGRWASSNFANSILSYLKSGHVNTILDYRKISPAISLHKTSESFEYPNEFKASKVYAPIRFQKKSFLDKQLKIMKRDIHKPQINVKIMHNDFRGTILKAHGLNYSENIKNYVTNTEGGERQYNRRHRFYRSVDDRAAQQIVLADIFKSQSLTASSAENKKSKDFISNGKLITILPFLKSNEYYFEHDKNNKSDITTRDLSNSNKWHNVKSYNNDYTPRRINMETNDVKENEGINIVDINKKFPSVRLKYIPDNHKLVKSDVDKAILNGRNLAIEISNKSDSVSDKVSIIKYNHGFLPGHTTRRKSNQDKDQSVANKEFTKKPHRNLNHDIKSGYTLNEGFVAGLNDDQNNNGFADRQERLRHMNSYRSNLDKVYGRSPSPSSGRKICKNLELFDRLLYIQPDESIDVIRIMSPVKQKNTAIEFILQNYKKCSLDESPIENNPLLYIDWSKTPVRLFGGAYPKKTTDLCGFF